MNCNKEVLSKMLHYNVQSYTAYVPILTYTQLFSSLHTVLFLALPSTAVVGLSAVQHVVHKRQRRRYK